MGLKPHRLIDKGQYVRVATAVSNSEKEWAAERDLDTLMEAERIKKDPKRLKCARDCAKKRKEEIVSDVAAISDIADKD